VFATCPWFGKGQIVRPKQLTAPLNKIFKAILIVTLFILGGQAVSFITQIIIASLFGAGVYMDAFLAASAVPQYVIAVLLGSLSFVFIPVFVDYIASGRENEAWKIASSVINLCLMVLGALVAIGIFFPGIILHLTAPGLSETTHTLAVQVAVIIWPSLLASGVILLVTGIYQSQSRFGWPAAVSVIGALVNLGLIVLLTRWWGIIGLAVASTTGLFLQVVLLLPVILRRGRYSLMLSFHHPGLLQVLKLLTPLAIANMVGKSTTLVERFLASSMPEGSISHLGYAFRLYGLFALLIATGITTVVFPRMAMNVANQDLMRLRRTMSVSLRFMWLAVAPATTLGIVLALPLVTVVFQRGQFSEVDAIAVTTLLRIYLLSLASACLANITGRGFYVLKDTRTVAILGSIETVAYVFYTAVLAYFWGVAGVALGFVLLFNGSLLWQVIILRYKTGNSGGSTILGSFSRIGLAAGMAGIIALVCRIFIPDFLLQLLFGGALGLVFYALALYGLRVNEAREIWNLLIKRTQITIT